MQQFLCIQYVDILKALNEAVIKKENILHVYKGHKDEWKQKRQLWL